MESSLAAEGALAMSARNAVFVHRARRVRNLPVENQAAAQLRGLANLKALDGVLKP
jgi:hypothetical protein